MNGRLRAISAFRAFGAAAVWFAPDLTARIYGGDTPDSS
jgi:hypothetical protein